jgi:transcriptional regulator with XRE-family HTH domain
MAKINLRQQALTLRKKGYSYKQIQSKIVVSKSTLSLWLRDFPLSEKRLRDLRDFSEVRIEKYRQTMQNKRSKRLEEVYLNVSKDIGKLTYKERFIAGLCLYWGEGGKTKWSELSMSNTDPSVLIFFISWLELIGGEKSKIRIRLQLYKDMDIKKEIDYWSKILRISKGQFRAPYIKKSNRSELTYKSKYTHGTCNVLYGNRDLTEKVFMSMEYIRKLG